MKRVIKTTAIAVVSLGLAAALSAPALASASARSADPITDLLGGAAGGSLLGGGLLGGGGKGGPVGPVGGGIGGGAGGLLGGGGGKSPVAGGGKSGPLGGITGGGMGSLMGGGGKGGQNPLMALTGPLNALMRSKSPIDGLTRSVDGASGSLDGTTRRLTPQYNLRNGLPLGDLSGAAGVDTGGKGFTAAGTPPLEMGVLDGREVLGVAHKDNPMDGVFASLSQRAMGISAAPMLEPVTKGTVPSVFDHLANYTEHAGTMADSVTQNLSSHPLSPTLMGPTEAVKGAMPDILGSELAPVVGPAQRQPMRGTAGAEIVSVDEVAPLVEGAATKVTDPSSTATLNEAIGRISQTATGALSGLAAK
ncbi:hypothetical protein [Nonomuraea longicatena]|uniref:PE-PGRS family protein n=1 Tax=Nonomuraea longicatena TaxID=83682 RepID=A0ABP3ZQ91_9ACTN